MRKLTWLILLLSALLCAPALAEDAQEPALMEVHQMNIGCADGYLIRVGDEDILIDGGNAGKGGLVIRTDHNIVGQGNAEDDHVLQYDHPV